MSQNQRYSIPRRNEPDLTFTGERLAAVMYNSHDARDIIELGLYQTLAGKYVAVRTIQSPMRSFRIVTVGGREGSDDWSSKILQSSDLWTEVWTFDEIEEIVDHLGYSDASKMLYTQLQLDVTEEVL